MVTLLTWLGKADIDSSKGVESRGIGPIAQAVVLGEFDRIEILSNYPESEYRDYARWLFNIGKTKPVMTPVKLSDPTDYAKIYEAARTKIKEILKSEPRTRLTFHLSPGTPAMSSVWLLLSKTFCDADLVQTSQEEGLKSVSLPFDISAEYVPRLIRKADEALTESSQGIDIFGNAHFRSKQMKSIVEFSQRAAVFNVPVLIEGESGTGKELFARGIHESGLRRDAPFVTVNCGAIPEQLVESELFGHTKGSFSGAIRDHDGHFVAANGGTVFLDEIGELPLSAQVKILRVLQEKEVMPVGSSRTRKTDVRIISATNRELAIEVAEARFREDLFYRLAVLVVKLPPLREREGDIGLLIDLFLKRFNESNDGKIWEGDKALTPGARTRLLRHSWPGNVRELENTLKRAAVGARGSRISESDVENSLFRIAKKQDGLFGCKLGNTFDLQELLGDVTRHYLTQAMQEANGNKSEAARLLGLSSYQTLTNWLLKYNIE
ncbi:MAG: sigma 54-interacting transcriptional regulator [Chloracidobacterium sp.]|nr:sigma 54-interacting transcriptional regulator [Chloracidobacterium sp.]